MVNKLINSRLSAVLPNPTASLDTWITANWPTTTGYTVPLIANIIIDTKFGSGKGAFFYIIIEEMPKKITPQILGSGRYVNTEVKRIQLLVVDNDAKTVKWNMERHLDSLINGNPTGLQTTYGIDWMHLTEFNEIPTSETDSTLTSLQPNIGFQKARSSALITLRYEQQSTTA